MSEATPPTSKNQSPADLVSDLVACALIEGARPTSMTATMATKAAKQAVLDQLDLLRIGRVNAQRINDNGASEIDRLRALVAEQQRNCSCPYGDCSTCEKAKAALSGEPGSGHETKERQIAMETLLLEARRDWRGHPNDWGAAVDRIFNPLLGGTPPLKANDE